MHLVKMIKLHSSDWLFQAELWTAAHMQRLKGPETTWPYILSSVIILALLFWWYVFCVLTKKPILGDYLCFFRVLKQIQGICFGMALVLLKTYRTQTPRLAHQCRGTSKDHLFLLIRGFSHLRGWRARQVTLRPLTTPTKSKRIQTNAKRIQS